MVEKRDQQISRNLFPDQLFGFSIFSPDDVQDRQAGLRGGGRTAETVNTYVKAEINIRCTIGDRRPLSGWPASAGTKARTAARIATIRLASTVTEAETWPVARRTMPVGQPAVAFSCGQAQGVAAGGLAWGNPGPQSSKSAPRSSACYNSPPEPWNLRGKYGTIRMHRTTMTAPLRHGVPSRTEKNYRGKTLAGISDPAPERGCLRGAR